MADQSSRSTPVDKEDNWGYDLYPERRGEAAQAKWWQVALFGAGQVKTEKISCERNVYNCFQNSNTTMKFKESIVIIFFVAGPLVKLMYSALKASGWYTLLIQLKIFYNTSDFHLQTVKST